MEPIDLEGEWLAPFLRYAHFFTVEKETVFQNVVCVDCRLFYFTQGEGYMKVAGCLYPVKKGTLLYWQAGVSYSFLPNEGASFWLYGLNFDLTQARRQEQQPISPVPQKEWDEAPPDFEVVQFSDLLPLNQSLILAEGAFSESVITEIHSEYLLKRQFYREKMNHLLAKLLLDLARAALFHQGGSGVQLAQAEEIIQYIRDHYWKPLSNEALGRIFHFHPSYVNRLILRYTGCSLHHYLLQYRLSISLNLLQTTNLTVTEIAERVGFSGLNYFSRYFKQVYGKSPTDFRR